MNFNPITKIDFMRSIHDTVSVTAREAIAAWQLEMSQRITVDDLPHLGQWLFPKYMILHSLTTLPEYDTVCDLFNISISDRLSLLHSNVFAHAWSEAQKAGEEFLKIANPIYPWCDVNDYQVTAREEAQAKWSLLFAIKQALPPRISRGTLG